MSLKPNQVRYLRGLAHTLKPVVLVGAKGETPALLAELESALTHHELVKLKIASDDRAERVRLTEVLAARSGADLVQRIGKTVCLYRRNPDQPHIELPR
jgi:RNA-binding protein